VNRFFIRLPCLSRPEVYASAWSQFRGAGQYVQATLQESPAAMVRKKLKAGGLTTRSREMQTRFGRDRAKTIQLFTAAGDFKSPESAARAALSVFVVLWQLPVTEWLWVTARNYDDRDEPKRPSVWPPAGL
jgi:hypothetical protein